MPRTVSVLLAGVLLCQSGCGEPSLDSPQYGEIIHQVPAELNEPIPLPELDAPSTTPAPGPQTSDEISVDSKDAEK